MKHKGISCYWRTVINIERVVATVLVSFLCITSTSSISADDIGDKNNESLGALPFIYHKYLPKLESLQKRYMEARRAKDDEEKGKIQLERKALTESVKFDIEQFNKTTPLNGKELPFEVVSENLPFDVLSIKIDKVSHKSIDFIVQVKINQDIKNPDGELSQRVSIHFVAVDSEDKIIPHTWSWATNDGWIKLKKDTIYDTQGHWNSGRVQNMQDFSTMNIMSKVDYEKMKESQ